MKPHLPQNLLHQVDRCWHSSDLKALPICKADLHLQTEAGALQSVTQSYSHQ